MANVTTIEVSKRDKIGSNASKQLRKSGRIPGVLYGHGQESVPITADGRSLEATLHTHAQFVELSIDGAVETALIREVQYDHYGQHVVHVDFVRVNLDEPIEVHIQVEYRGMPKGVSAGGVLQRFLTEVPIRVAPRYIPDEFIVNVSHLDVGDSILMGDVELPASAELVGDPSKPICSVVSSTAQVVATEEADTSEPEVVGQKPGDTEGES